MSKAFTHYWKNSTWRSSSRGVLTHTAGNQFEEREVQPGSRLFIVTVLDGRLLLGGRIVVDRIVGPDVAARALKMSEDELWDAEEFALCKTAEERPFLENLEVPTRLARQLRFGGGEALKWEAAGRIHRQTLRGVREFSAESAKLMERILADAERRPSVAPAEIEDYARIADVDFDVSSIADARKRIVRAIHRRQGQQAFRRRLLHAYGGRCAISGCSTEHVLEAAHIVPYQGTRTNHTQNGLLLRGDIHTLFDLNLIKILPEDYRIEVAPSLSDSEYRVFDGKKIRLPRNPRARPHPGALRRRRELVES